MSVDSAFALPDLSTAASHAGAMMTAGALSNPAETKSRRVTGRLWFSCRSGSPSARGRTGFLRMNMWILSLFPLLQSHRGAGEHGRAGSLGSLGHGCSGAQSRNSREQRVESGSEEGITQRLCIDQLSAVCRGQLRDGRLLGRQERVDPRGGGQRLLLRVV